MIEKNLGKVFSKFVKLTKKLKSHATNLCLLDNGLVLLQSIIPGVKAYATVDVDGDEYWHGMKYLYIGIVQFNEELANFSKSSSEILWKIKDNMTYLVLSNKDESKFEYPILDKEEVRKDLIQSTYGSIPDWDDSQLEDEVDDIYINLGPDFIKAMVEKNLCEIPVVDTSIFISRPFLGDLKNTSYLGYRIYKNYDDKIILKFKQKEDLCTIYTYAAFIKYHVKEG